MRELILDRPLVFFDLEATGTNPQMDRIVECAFVRVPPAAAGGVAERIFRERVNPGIPIPTDARIVHGITNEDVADARRFADVLPDVLEVCDGADLCGYNMLRFDLPLLMAEARRAGGAFSLEGRRLIDPQVIFHRREPRDLLAAHRRFVGFEYADAHGALADAQATASVLTGMLQDYLDLGPGVDALHVASMEGRENFVDFEGKVRFDVDGDAVLTFGKYQGRMLRNVDRWYFTWAIDQDFAPDVKAIFAAALRGEFPRRPEAVEESKR